MRTAVSVVCFGIISGFLIGAGLSVAGRGSHGTAFLGAAVGAGVFAIGLLLLAVSVAVPRARARGGTMRLVALWFWVAGIITLPSLLVGSAVTGREIEEAKQYCESRLSELESYRRHHGRYPAALPSGQAEEPALISRQDYYFGYPDHFVFRLNDPRYIYGSALEFDSREGRWQRLHGHHSSTRRRTTR